MGSLQDILSMIPGMNTKDGGIQIDEKQHPEPSYQQSMTPEENRSYQL